MNPMVSVVLYVRNEEKYIGDCIKSILSQTYEDFEVIIVDDMSSDHTQSIIKGFDDERIRHFRNEEWRGIAESRNRGLKYAKAQKNPTNKVFKLDDAWAWPSRSNRLSCLRF